ncbi:GNAT family N-acetyltransferase [Parvularcula sp. IMCC14364]|uniref:GNAT family N-acetyltransferase n=1 Tax=Parvularcula sp. IMCC14364 TaxID=3067902 RepID=UPI002740416F|nr:GNAT family N-acetyltransferase [Parvularcula sp. IMCC14364]
MQKTFDVTITYLEQNTRPQFPLPFRPAGKTALIRSETPPLHYYRYLYDQVGGPFHWVSRRYMPDEDLAEIIHNPDVYIYVLYYNGSPCGMAEVDTRKDCHPPGTVEIKFFGLMPDFIGKRLGRWFLHNVVDLAWSLDPERVVLETCTADHPAALPLYQKLGFSVYDQGKGVIEWRG